LPHLTTRQAAGSSGNNALKSTDGGTWTTTSVGAARNHFQWWYNWATHGLLQPVIEVARTLKARLANILTYLRHRITDATSESINAKIQWVKYTARGFRNKQNSKPRLVYEW
jgi:transposase